MTSPITLSDVERARERLAPWLAPTPVRTYPTLDQIVPGVRLLVKHENMQPTGSFKVRNGLSTVTALGDAERQRGVVGATTGNHGLGLAYSGCQRTDVARRLACARTTQGDTRRHIRRRRGDAVHLRADFPRAARRPRGFRHRRRRRNRRGRAYHSRDDASSRGRRWRHGRRGGDQAARSARGQVRWRHLLRREHGHRCAPPHPESRAVGQLTVLVFRFRKSMRMNCPSVMVVVKYALPRLISLMRFTNSTRARSRASMKVLIMMPAFRHAATS